MLHWNWAIRRPTSLGALAVDAVVAASLLLAWIFFPSHPTQDGNMEGRIEVLEEQEIRQDQRINLLEMRPAAARDAEARLTRLEDRLATVETERDRERQDQKDTNNHIWITAGALFTGLLGLAVERILYRKKPNGG